MGDANGISAEIIAKTLGKKKNLSFLPVVFGDLSIFQKCFVNFCAVFKKTKKFQSNVFTCYDYKQCRGKH